jgi:hypothetical protein
MMTGEEAAAAVLSRALPQGSGVRFHADQRHQ